jgi:NAD-dependent SIR2 family protein deacetylase
LNKKVHHGMSGEVDIMKKSGEVVFLVGAGASQSLNIPAMGGMFDAFLQSSRNGISRDNKRICEMFVSKLGVPRDLEEFLLAINTIVEPQTQGIWKLTEKIISPSKKGTRFEKFKIKLQKHISDIEDTREHILDFMSKICFRFDREKAYDILAGFVDAVSRQGYPVYTTNFDFSLEYVAEEKGITIKDNFVQKGRRQIWDSAISFPLGNALTIVKLHGSVTWYLDDNDIIEKIESHTTLNPAGKSVERLVIFPTRFKDIYDQHFFALYSHFLATLSSAKCLVVIGHSLRDEYLRAGIIERFRKKGLSIVIVDPYWPQSLPSELRPAKVGTADTLTHIPQKFEDFSNELAHIILNESVTSIGKACAATLRQMKFKKNKLKLKGNIRVLKPEEDKVFSVSVDAYIHRYQRPINIYAWLEAEFQLPSGEHKKEMMGSFLNVGNTSLSLDLSGTLKTDVLLNIKIPKYPDWLNYANKVRLRVALVEKSQRKPRSLKPEMIIAEDYRELTYTK